MAAASCAIWIWISVPSPCARPKLLGPHSTAPLASSLVSAVPWSWSFAPSVPSRQSRTARSPLANGRTAFAVMRSVHALVHVADADVGAVEAVSALMGSFIMTASPPVLPYERKDISSVVAFFVNPPSTAEAPSAVRSMLSQAPLLPDVSPKSVAVHVSVPEARVSLVMERFATPPMTRYPTASTSPPLGSWMQALAASLPLMFERQPHV